MYKGTPAVLWLRVFAAAVLAIGAVLWYQGGRAIPISWGKVTASIPVELLLVVVGMGGLLLPLGLIHLLPDRWRARVQAALGVVDAQDALTANNPSPQDLARILKQHIEDSRRRVALALAATLVTVAIAYVITPIALRRFNEQAELERALRMLFGATQELRLDYTSADAARAVVALSAPIANSSDSAARELYAYYSRLYSVEVGDQTQFEATMREIYVETVRGRSLPTACPTGDPSSTLPPRHTESQIALCTFLGVVSNEQGEQGTYLEPYDLGRQYLETAHSLATELGASAPATHIALGWNLSDSLKASARSSKEVGDRASVAPSQGMATSRLRMARRAWDEHAHPEGSTLTRRTRARLVNNRTDLWLYLIRAVHIDHTIADDGVGDASDREFWRVRTGMPPAGTAEEPAPLKELWDALAELRRDMDTAVELSSESRLFFTRAQVTATAAELAVKYLPEPGDLQSEAESAVDDLEMARKLGVHESYFRRSTAARMYLGWLWTQPMHLPRLNELSQPSAAKP